MLPQIETRDTGRHLGVVGLGERVGGLHRQLMGIPFALQLEPARNRSAQNRSLKPAKQNDRPTACCQKSVTVGILRPLEVGILRE